MERNISSNKDILITPKGRIIGNFFIILGFLTPFPIYINANDFSLFLFEFDFNQVKVVIEEGTAIPIGVFSLLVYIFGVLVRTGSLGYIIRYGFFVFSFLFIVLQGFDLYRIPILIAPILFLLFLRKTIISKYFPKDGFALGYLIGLLAVYSSNIFSYLFFISINPPHLTYSRQVFGLEIWQYYVTYSAVASCAFGTFALFLFLNYKSMKKIKGFFIFTLFFIFLAALLPLRKAFFLDIIIVFGLMFGSSFKELINLKIKKHKFIILSVVALLSIFVVSWGLYERKGIYANSRIGLIWAALDLVEIDPFKILFGFQSGFGGYSNLVLELIIRAGLVGFLSYIGSVFYFFKKYLNSLTNINGIDKFKNHIVLMFILFNLFLGNLVNLNFGTPYFVLNFASILIVFTYLDILSRLKKIEKI